MAIERITLSPRTYVGIRRKVPVTELQGYFSEVLPRVMRWVTESGLEPASAPMARWHAMDPQTGVADVQAGCFVAEPVPDDGDITCDTTPAGEALRLTHVGSYDDMKRSWGALFRHASDQGLTPGAGWEIYVDDPSKTDPETMRTEITLPVR